MEAHIKRPVPARSSSHRSFRTTQSPRERAAAAPPPSSPHHASPPTRRQPSPRDRSPLALDTADSASRHRDRHLQQLQQRTPTTRAPSTDSSPAIQGTPSSARSRRLSSSSTATRPTPGSVSSSGSYFGPLAASSSPDARSPALRKPPASHSSHGIETSYGPPIALITRRRSTTTDVARRSQSPADAAPAQHDSSPFSASSPAPAAHTRHTRNNSDTTVTAPPEHRRGSSRIRSLPTSRATSPTSRRPLSRSVSDSRARAMANNSFSDSQSDYDFAYSHRSRPDDYNRGAVRDANGSSSEDLFLNIAQDSPRNQDGDDDTVKVERRRSRIARMSRQSLPANSLNSPTARTAGDTAIKTPTIQTRLHSHIRRASNLPSPSYNSPLSAREPPSGVTASFPADGSRVRSFGMTSSGSFGLSRSSRDQDDSQNRRSSIPDPARVSAAAREQRYRTSNQSSYSSRYTQPTTPLESSPEIVSKPEQQSRTSDGRDGSESLESTTAASTVWDELDDLKSRIKKLELTGKMPPTSGAAVTQHTADRPRTATTQATSVTASPKQQRKASVSPPETTVSGAISGATGASHPLLHSALAKCRDQMNPSFFRVLEATANDALELAAMTAGGGNQSSAVSVNGVQTSERQLRRKADNMCRSLTELCIALCDTPMNGKSPTLKSPGLAPPPSRRQSVQINGDRERERDRDRERDLPPRGGSAEPEGGMRNSPSRALDRIEARRTSMLINGGSAGNSPREPSERDRTTPTQQSSRYQQRSGTSLINRPRRATVNNDDQPEMEDESSLRVPSRAMTDFTQNNRQSHGNRSNRLSREYTSNVPLPDGASVALQHATSIRRPNGTVAANDSPTANSPTTSFLRDRRQLERTPAYETPRTADGYGSDERRQRLSLYQNSTPRTAAAAIGIGRTASLSRRLRQDI